MEILVGVLVFVVLATIALNAIVRVEPVHFAVPNIFGRRSSRVLTEGLSLRIPFVESVTEEFTYSLRPQPIAVDFSVFTADRREIIISGLIRWRPDPKITNRMVHNLPGDRYSDMVPENAPDPNVENNESPRFVEITPEMLERGVVSKVESEIGRFAGLHSWKDFIDRRRAVEHFINSILRLTIPPHVDPEEIMEQQLTNYPHLQGRSSEYCSEGAVEVDKDKRLPFYDIFSGPIGDRLREEKNVEDRSIPELFYGVDLLEFTIDNVDFSDRTKEALEARERAEDEIEGKRQYHNEIINMAQKLREESDDDLSWREAVETAKVVLGLTESKEFSIRGIPESVSNLIGGIGS